MNIKIFSCLIFIVSIVEAQAQDNGILWIGTFAPGSSKLSEATVDSNTMAALDSLMSIEDIEVTFYGAADNLGWVASSFMNRLLNLQIKIDRGEELQKKYNRGTVSTTYESRRAVKVKWKHTNNNTVLYNTNIDTSFISDIGLKIGILSWMESNKIISLNITLDINISKIQSNLIAKAGISPLHSDSEWGKVRDSFVYLGGRHWVSHIIGIEVGVIRGWEVLTGTDNWISRSTGVSFCGVYRFHDMELNGSITHSTSKKFGIIFGIEYILR